MCTATSALLASVNNTPTTGDNASGANNDNGTKKNSKTNNSKSDTASNSGGGGGGGGTNNPTNPIIPRQNKGLCTICDVTIWIVLESNLEIKWCKGCKNFRPWAAFGDKGLATKCVKCRDRQREKYALQKEDLRKQRLKSGGGDSDSTTDCGKKQEEEEQKQSNAENDKKMTRRSKKNGRFPNNSSSSSNSNGGSSNVGEDTAEISHNTKDIDNKNDKQETIRQNGTRNNNNKNDKEDKKGKCFDELDAAAGLNHLMVMSKSS